MVTDAQIEARNRLAELILQKPGALDGASYSRRFEEAHSHRAELREQGIPEGKHGAFKGKEIPTLDAIHHLLEQIAFTERDVVVGVPASTVTKKGAPPDFVIQLAASFLDQPRENRTVKTWTDSAYYETVEAAVLSEHARRIRRLLKVQRRTVQCKFGNRKLVFGPLIFYGTRIYALLAFAAEELRNKKLASQSYRYEILTRALNENFRWRYRGELGLTTVQLRIAFLRDSQRSSSARLGCLVDSPRLRQREQFGYSTDEVDLASFDLKYDEVFFCRFDERTAQMATAVQKRNP